MDVTRILNLIAESNLSEFAFEKQNELAQGSIKNWKNGRNKPSAEALVKIANYFQVSIDYLLGRTDTPGFSPAEKAIGITETAMVSLTPEEDDVLEDFRQLGIKKGADAQRAAHEVIKAMLK